MSYKVKIIITLALCILLALSVIFHEYLWSGVLFLVLLAKKSLFKILMVLKQFFFKQGVVSFATIAWKKVLVSSSLALSKRAIINGITGFFQERIVKPLIHPATRYLRVRWAIFKASNWWKKIYTVVFGSVPATIMLYAIGFWDTLLLLMKGFSLAKLLTFILKLIVMCFAFFQSIWRTWIRPYIDLIIITIFITYMEKIPVFGGFLRRIRITIKWWWRHYRRHKDRLIDQHVDQRVNLFSERIHQHVNKKKEEVALMTNPDIPAAVVPKHDEHDIVVEAPELEELEARLPDQRLRKMEEDAERVGRVILKIDKLIKPD